MDWLDIYKQNLAAQSLSMRLHEASVEFRYERQISSVHSEGIDKDFRELANRLGYRVERIEAPASATMMAGDKA